MSKQAYYQKLQANKRKEIEAINIKKLVEPIRKKMPRYGTEKLHLDIANDLQKQGIKMGRDKFLKFARQHHLLVPKTKRCFITTDSNHMYHKPPNRIKNLEITNAEQVYVSDITYIKLDGKHAYLALVTDLYSKKIMGYKIDDNMKVSLVKEALQMAVNKQQYARENIIHHSDRGLQYCCPDYTEFATKRKLIMSTTEKYDPYENAVAERINATIKYEFGLIKTIPNLDIATKMVCQAVNIYNQERRHCSLQMQTPNFAHNNQIHQYKSYKKKTGLKPVVNVD
jgi:transposase InsO family protein